MPNKNGNGRKVLDRLFPVEYDFYQMLVEQSEQITKGVKDFQRWTENGHLSDVDDLVRMEENLDNMRYELQHKLHEAFSTPFDREELYSLSRQMDNIINYSVLTAKQMRAYGVPPDAHSKEMTKQLVLGMEHMSQAMRLLQEGEAASADAKVADMRNCQRAIEDLYIKAMGEMFTHQDVFYVLKHSEIYRNLMETGNNLRICTDMFHRVLVGLM